MKSTKEYSRKDHLNKRIQRAKNNFWSTLKNVEITGFNDLELDY